MAQQIIECVPNFSEGRRKPVIDAIVNAIQSVDGVVLLDRSSDRDHNRSVITFVGDGKAVAEAAFRGIAKAADLIDMTKHKGEHPRMGAADVVPFVPIAGASMQDCVRIAHQLGKKVGTELKIPVYFYEEAATREERRNLENVRRGEYEGIRGSIGKDPARTPDFGPSQLGKAGAVAIGARAPLIAYNVYLDASDVEIAKKIAATVRHSSGGFRYVKGAGFLVAGKAQVSMNLTNFHKTPMAQVVELTRREAGRYGTRIAWSELVGLIPQEALEDAAVWYLQLKDFDRQQVLERRMQEATKGSVVQKSEDAFLEALASATPTPGGGSAAAQAGAMAAALVAMVARLTVGKKKYSGVEAKMLRLIEQADNLRAQFTQTVKRDAESFEAVLAAMKLPKETKKQQTARERSIQTATLEATRQPLIVARLAVKCLELVSQAVELGNINAISDAGTAAVLAVACLQGAGYNVRINVHSLGNEKRGTALLKELKALEKKAKQHEAAIRKMIRSRGGFQVE